MTKRMGLFSLKQSGDTIVEVLFSIAILSAVLAGAYSLATHDLNIGITSSEHTQALKLATGQLESLKFRQQQSSRASFLNDFAAQPNGPVNYCLNTDATGPTDSSWAPIKNSNTLDTTTFTGYADQCHSLDPAGKFYANINVINTKLTSGTIQTVYLVTVSWTSVDGQLQQTKMFYRF